MPKVKWEIFLRKVFNKDILLKSLQDSHGFRFCVYKLLDYCAEFVFVCKNQGSMKFISEYKVNTVERYVD